ncbi:MAG: hypothetical protein IJJ15_05410 [Ruminococcus sp.]|nr:hypothetical protein [Ruminococcus sp.]
MKKTTISIIAIALCAVLALCLLTACGEKKTETDPTVATTASTTATTATTEKATSGDSGSDAQSQSATTGVGGHSIFDAWYAGIAEQDAGIKALDYVGSGGRIISTQTGYYSDGSECWVVEVIGNGSEQYICYVSGSYFYASPIGGAGINDAYYADISEQKAGQDALDATGESGLITGSAAGYYTDGSECWIITITANSGTQYIAYVSGDYCYISAIGESIFSDSYAGISEQDAGMQALSALGIDNSFITGTSKGYGNDGEECWYIYIVDPDSNYYTYAVTSMYCTQV